MKASVSIMDRNENPAGMIGEVDFSVFPREGEMVVHKGENYWVERCGHDIMDDHIHSFIILMTGKEMNEMRKLKLKTKP